MAELVEEDAHRPEDVSVLALELGDLDRLVDPVGHARRDEIVRGDPDVPGAGRVRQHGLEVVLCHERGPHLVAAVVEDVGLLAGPGVEEDDRLIRPEVDGRVGERHHVPHHVDEAFLEMVVVAVVGHRLGQGEDRVRERRRERDLAVRGLIPVLVQEEEKAVVVRGR
jgi:hypothetical protein